MHQCLQLNIQTAVTAGGGEGERNDGLVKGGQKNGREVSFRGGDGDKGGRRRG